MKSARPTHSYPYGRPRPLALIDGVAVILFILWIVLASSGWNYALTVVTLAIVLVIVRWRLLARYKRTGRAVPIPKRTSRIRYVAGTPVPVVVLRCLFCLLAAGVLVISFAPLSFTTIKAGMIGCILSLFVLAVTHMALESHYLQTGRAVHE